MNKTYLSLRENIKLSDVEIESILIIKLNYPVKFASIICDGVLMMMHTGVK